MTVSVPKISIVTPSFNQGAYIEDALLSVKQQDYPSLEHIVMDGGSTDGTVDVLRQYAAKPGWEHLHWVSEPDRGQTDALNKGFRQATGKVWAYLCADDFYAGGALNCIVQFFEAHPSVELIYGNCLFVDDLGHPLRLKKAVPFDSEKLTVANYIWQPTVFFRPSVWEKVGTFNEDLEFAMDYEYWLRVSRKCAIKALEVHLANYRWQRNSKTVSQERSQLREAYAVARRFGGGGLRSWYLHHVYWPNTSALKRWAYSWLMLFTDLHCRIS
jgi:glycosyltransferase involved in cell wall biosynthesis